MKGGSAAGEEKGQDASVHGQIPNTKAHEDTNFLPFLFFHSLLSLSLSIIRRSKRDKIRKKGRGQVYTQVKSAWNERETEENSRSERLPCRTLGRHGFRKYIYIYIYIRFNLRRNPARTTVLGKFFLPVHHESCLAAAYFASLLLFPSRSAQTLRPPSPVSIVEARRNTRRTYRWLKIGRNERGSLVQLRIRATRVYPRYLPYRSQELKDTRDQNTGFANLIWPPPLLSSSPYHSTPDISHFPPLSFETFRDSCSFVSRIFVHWTATTNRASKNCLDFTRNIRGRWKYIFAIVV